MTRALLPAAKAEAGSLYVDRDAHWFLDFERECIAFPLAQHDDQVDALSGALQIAYEKLAIYKPPSVYSMGDANSSRQQNDWGWRGAKSA